MWTDMNPEASDVVFCGVAYDRNGNKSQFCIDRIREGDGPNAYVYFRATVGNLFGSQEVTRGANLEMVLRRFYQALNRGKFAA